MAATRFLLLDTCVLVDYLETDPDVFDVVSCALGRFRFARPLVREVLSQRAKDALPNAAVEIIDVESDVCFRASAHVKGAPDEWGALSQYDVLCLLTALRGGYVCVTNDARLFNECKRRGVPCRRGLAPVLDAVQKGALSKERADLFASALVRSNPRVAPSVLDDFRRKLALL